MKLCRLVLLLVLGTTTPATESLAQPTVMEASPETAALGVFLGDWVRQADPEGSPGPKSARLSITWGPGDVWMTWEMTAEFPSATTIAGRRLLTWNAADSAYRSVWIDTQSAVVHKGEARWIADAAFEILSEPFDWPDGHRFQFRVNMVFTSPTEIEETLWRATDGGAFEKAHSTRWIRY